MGLVPMFFEIATKQQLLLGYVCEIPRCYCRKKKFSAKSDFRVNSADFEVGENEKIIREKQKPLVLKVQSLIGV